MWSPQPPPPRPPIKFPLLWCFPAGCAQTKAAWLFWVWEAVEVGAPSGCGGGAACCCPTGAVLAQQWALCNSQRGGARFWGSNQGFNSREAWKLARKKGFQGNSGNFLFLFNDKTAWQLFSLACIQARWTSSSWACWRLLVLTSPSLPTWWRAAPSSQRASKV